MLTVEQFCNKHDACPEGRNWALDNCNDMADVWTEAKPEWLIWVGTRQGVLSDKELRLFAVFCARQVSHLLTDERSLNAIEVAERFAHGQASREELSAAWAAAYAAAGAAAYAAARAAADRAAESAAWNAARVAYASAAGVAGVAAMSAQAEWLRKNTSPVFGR